MQARASILIARCRYGSASRSSAWRLFPIAALLLAEFLGRSAIDLVIFALIGVVIGIMGPRLILSSLKRRFAAAVRRGTPDAIDLLVVCSEAGMGLESAVARVAEEIEPVRSRHGPGLVRSSR